MPSRISPSQLRSKMRQAQQRHRQEINKVNQKIREHNRKVKSAVDSYNREVRAHNARVRANRARLASEINKLKSYSSSNSYISLRNSVDTVQNKYRAVEQNYSNGYYDDKFNNILDLSEKEAANSASVVNALFGDPEPEQDSRQLDEGDPELISFLAGVSADLGDRWKGALFSLSPQNPDAARHFCTSAREVITEILESEAPDYVVRSEYSACEYTPQGKPTRRSKIGFLLNKQGLLHQDLTEFVEADISNLVELFRTFNDGTHGSAGKFNLTQLHAIKRRVEDGLSFLSRIVG